MAQQGDDPAGADKQNNPEMKQDRQTEGNVSTVPDALRIVQTPTGTKLRAEIALARLKATPEGLKKLKNDARSLEDSDDLYLFYLHHFGLLDANFEEINEVEQRLRGKKPESLIGSGKKLDALIGALRNARSLDHPEGCDLSIQWAYRRTAEGTGEVEYALGTTEESTTIGKADKPIIGYTGLSRAICIKEEGKPLKMAIKSSDFELFNTDCFAHKTNQAVERRRVGKFFNLSDKSFQLPDELEATEYCRRALLKDKLRKKASFTYAKVTHNFSAKSPYCKDAKTDGSACTWNGEYYQRHPIAFRIQARSGAKVSDFANVALVYLNGPEPVRIKSVPENETSRCSDGTGTDSCFELVPSDINKKYKPLGSALRITLVANPSEELAAKASASAEQPLDALKRETLRVASNIDKALTQGGDGGALSELGGEAQCAAEHMRYLAESIDGGTPSPWTKEKYDGGGGKTCAETKYADAIKSAPGCTIDENRTSERLSGADAKLALESFAAADKCALIALDAQVSRALSQQVDKLTPLVDSSVKVSIDLVIELQNKAATKNIDLGISKEELEAKIEEPVDDVQNALLAFSAAVSLTDKFSVLQKMLKDSSSFDAALEARLERVKTNAVASANDLGVDATEIKNAFDDLIKRVGDIKQQRERLLAVLSSTNNVITSIHELTLAHGVARERVEAISNEITSLSRDPKRQALVINTFISSQFKDQEEFFEARNNASPAPIEGAVTFGMTYEDPLQIFSLATWNMLPFAPRGSAYDNRLNMRDVDLTVAIPVVDVIGARFQWRPRLARGLRGVTDLRVALGAAVASENVKFSIEDPVTTQGVDETIEYIEDSSLTAGPVLSIGLGSLRLGAGYMMGGGPGILRDLELVSEATSDEMEVRLISEARQTELFGADNFSTWENAPRFLKEGRVRIMIGVDLLKLITGESSGVTSVKPSESSQNKSKE